MEQVSIKTIGIQFLSGEIVTIFFMIAHTNPSHISIEIRSLCDSCETWCVLFSNKITYPLKPRKSDATLQVKSHVMTLGTEQICLECRMPKNS